jgi:hypothetical protein
VWTAFESGRVFRRLCAWLHAPPIHHKPAATPRTDNRYDVLRGDGVATCWYPAGTWKCEPSTGAVEKSLSVVLDSISTLLAGAAGWPGAFSAPALVPAAAPFAAAV